MPCLQVILNRSVLRPQRPTSAFFKDATCVPSSGHSQIQGKDVIVSLLLERYGVAAEALKDQGLVFEGGFMRRLSDAEKHARQQSEYNVEVEAQADLSVHMIPNNIKDAFNRRFLNEVVTSPEFKEEIGRAVLRTAERKLSSGPT